MNIFQVIALIGIFSISAMVMSFIYKIRTHKDKIKELELQKKIMELEIEKENVKIKSLEEENKKYDRIINEESQK